MKIGVVGNRKGWIHSRVYQELIKHLDGLEMIISGGADGVDSIAQAFAESYGIPILIIYPKPSLGYPYCFFERNKRIAEKCDLLIAFNNKEKSGTGNTIRHACKLGKRVIEVKR